MTTQTTPAAPATTAEKPPAETPATSPLSSSEADRVLQELAGVNVIPGDNDKTTLEESLIRPPTVVEVIQQGGEASPAPGLETGLTGTPQMGLTNDFKAPMTLTTISDPGHIYIYNRYTGDRQVCNINMLPAKLRNRVNSNKDPNYGKLVFTVVDPGFRPKQGTGKCWLHTEGEWRALADEWGLAVCPKSNIVSTFEIREHMKNKHTRNFEAIDDHRKELERQEDREERKSLLKAIAANQEAGRAPVEVAEKKIVIDGPVKRVDATDPQPGKVTIGDVSDSNPPLVTKEPDIWKDAHKSKNRPRRCPMSEVNDCDWTTRSKSNKVARSTIGRHRKEKHPETLNA